MSNNHLITFNCEKQFYYFLIFWVLELVINLFNNLFPTEFLTIKISFNNIDKNEEELENIKINELIIVLCKIFSELFAGIANLCNNEPIIENIKKDKKKFFYLMITSVFLIICKSRNFLYYLFSESVKRLNDSEINWEIGLFIISTIIFCKYINKEITFYLHHKVSIVITLLAFIFMSSFDIYCLIKDKDIQISDKIINIIIYTFFSIYYPFSHSVFKVLMNDFLPPIILTFWIRIFHSIILIIILPIFFFTKIIKLGEIEFDSVTFIIWILIKICYIIFYFIRQLIIYIIINKNNPAYMIFMISINSFISFIAPFFVNKKDKEYKEPVFFIIFDCISLILLSFAGLLFNEILIVHKFGLDLKTKSSLKIKAVEEILGNEEDDRNTFVY